ncbi:hypothetical protein [Streptomyces sp. NPDC058572]|uniref:hypothetical protein n=1 Tax=Streptomyces sp. NPDC058572 TaxID=3346546 RepID=UPI0036605DD6
MGLYMSWTIDHVGSAGQNVKDVEAAGYALMGSVERARRAFGAETSWQRVWDWAALLRDQMLDAGCKAVQRGEQWSATVGGVSVVLIPRGDP